MLRTPLHRLRTVGHLEGVSFLVLLGVAMPLKYLAGLPMAVQAVGWIHGVLFMVYLAAVGEAALEQRWGWRWVVGALLAAVLPFGPFVFDARLRRAEAAGSVRVPGRGAPARAPSRSGA